MPDLPTGTVTFLFTDIEGSTRLWEQHPEAMRAALARHDALLRAAHRATRRPRRQDRGAISLFAVFATRRRCARRGAGAPAAPAHAEPVARARSRAAGADGAAHRRGRGCATATTSARRQPLRPAAGGWRTAGRCCSPRPRTSWCATTLPERAACATSGSHRLEDLQRPEQVFQLLHPDLPGRLSAAALARTARRTTCRCSSPASSAGSGRWRRSGSCWRSTRAADPDRRGRLRARRAWRCRWRRTCWRSIRTASGWWSWRRWPTRRWCRRRWPRRWACGRSRAGRCRRRWSDYLQAEAAAAGAGQLRAPARRLRRSWPTRCCARCPRRADPGHQPRGAGHRRRDDLPGALARRCPTPGSLPPPGDACRSTRRCASSSTGPLARQPGFALTDAERAGGGADLPPAGRHPAGHRAGGGAGAGAAGGADRRAAGRPLPAADRRQPHGAAPPADAAGADRLELRPAHRAGADCCCAGSPCSPAAGRWRRRRRSCAGDGDRSRGRCWTC